MKTIVICLLVLVLGLAVVTRAPAQDPAPIAPDLGTADVRVSACHFAGSVAMAEGLKITWCRAGTREEVVYLHGGVVAIVPLTVRAEGVDYKLSVHMNRSLWSGSALALK